MLAVHKVKKKYGNTVVLHDVDLELKNGIHALLAPNGAGKTTLLRILATVLMPEDGTITLDGESIWEMDGRYRGMLGYLPQKVGFYHNYTPAQFLRYLAVLKQVEEKQAERRMEQLIVTLGLEGERSKKLRHLSGGMIQRVGIAGALLNNPKVLLLDEPTAGLDPSERSHIKNMLSELSRERIVLLSTHITSDIDFIANQVILLKDGTVHSSGTVQELCDSLRGKVFETTVDFAESYALRARYMVISEQQDENGAHIRFLADEEIDDSWSLCAPTIEDVFLSTYASGSALKEAFAL